MMAPAGFLDEVAMSRCRCSPIPVTGRELGSTLGTALGTYQRFFSRIHAPQGVYSGTTAGTEIAIERHLVVPFPIRKGVVANVHIETTIRKQFVKLSLCLVVFPNGSLKKTVELLKLINGYAVPMAAIILR